MKDTIKTIRTTLKSKDFVPGMLLHGPPGCGKTMLAKTIAKEMDGHFFHLKASSFSQKQEYNVQNAETLFSLAIKLQPSIIFIDEIDVALGSKGKDEVRHVFQTHMDGFNTDKTSRALVLGTTNHIHDMNKAVLRRFTTKIEVPKPSLEDRIDIMRIQLSHAHCKSHADIDLKSCASETNDFTGSDLFQVIQSANSMSSETPDKTITLKLLMKAIQEWKSGKELTNEEELVAKDYHTAKDTLHHTWCDIGGLDETISSIKTMLPTMCDDKGKFMSERILLLHGPSGCGKTMIANAIAGEKGLYFLDVIITNLLAQPTTTALSQMKTVFTLAVKKKPSAIFMDNVGALMGETETKTCLRDQIINEVKRLTSRKIPGVIFVGATNQLERINADFQQMFSSQIYIDAPDTKGREDILQKLLRDRLSKDMSIDLVALAEASKGCNGSDLYNAYQRAVHESSNDAAEEVGKLMLQALEKLKGDKKEAGIPFPSRGHIPLSEDEKIVVTDILDPSTVNLSLKQICGLDAIVQRIVKRVIEPLTEALANERLQKGVLLYGPTGCGKTLIATALAKYPGLTVLQFIPTTVTSNDGVRALFSLANKLAPTIIFIDGMHSFMKNESPQSTMKAEFLRYWDETKKTNKIVVLGTTINTQDVDEDIRDRMTLKLELNKPTPEQRRNIIEMLLKGTQYDSFIIDDIVEKTEGFSGRGLNNMVKNAKLDAEDDGRNKVTLDDLKSSL